MRYVLLGFAFAYLATFIGVVASDQAPLEQRAFRG